MAQGLDGTTDEVENIHHHLDNDADPEDQPPSCSHTRTGYDTAMTPSPI